jgi:hypothetical protein
MGVAKAMCQTPLFSAKRLTISCIQPTIMFRLAATLCENGGTPKMTIRSKDIFMPPLVPHPISEASCTKVSKVQLESWHAAMAKLHDLPTRPTIDQTNVILEVVVVHNEEGVVQLKGALAQ